MEHEKSDKFLEGQIIAALMQQTANENLGITQEYNKENREKLWDSAEEKKNFKNKTFGDKNTYTDEINEQTLHKSTKAAKNKYHMKNAEGETISHKWAQHASETDHINALKDVHNIAKHNPFLTDKDFKEIMNTEENYRVLSKSLNASKKDKSDFEIIFDKNSGISKAGKRQMIKEKITADIALQKKFAARTAKNIGVEFKNGTEDTLIHSVMPLTEKAIQNMIETVQGQKGLKEAAKDMSKAVIQTAVVGGRNQILLDMIKNSEISALKNIVKSKQAEQLISIVSIVKDSALKYINGEIDKEQFIDEIGEKGTIIVASMIGGMIGKEIGTIVGFALPLPVIGPIAGRVAGEILGTIITSLSCAVISAVSQLSLHIRSEMKNIDSYKKYEKQIRTLQNEALMEIEKQRKHFMEIAKRENAKLYEEIQMGFDTMLSCACEAAYDVNGVTEGLDRILSVFGKSVRFRTLDEYEAQLDQPLKLSF